MLSAQDRFDELKASVKFRPTAWRQSRRDPWQIGYGHTDGVQEGDTCTMEQADAFLRDDIANLCAA